MKIIIVIPFAKMDKLPIKLERREIVPIYEFSCLRINEVLCQNFTNNEFIFY